MLGAVRIATRLENNTPDHRNLDPWNWLPKRTGHGCIVGQTINHEDRGVCVNQNCNFSAQTNGSNPVWSLVVVILAFASIDRV